MARVQREVLVLIRVLALQASIVFCAAVPDAFARMLVVSTWVDRYDFGEPVARRTLGQRDAVNAIVRFQEQKLYTQTQRRRLTTVVRDLTFAEKTFLRSICFPRFHPTCGFSWNPRPPQFLESRCLEALQLPDSKRNDVIII